MRSSGISTDPPCDLTSSFSLGLGEKEMEAGVTTILTPALQGF